MDGLHVFGILKLFCVRETSTFQSQSPPILPLQFSSPELRSRSSSMEPPSFSSPLSPFSPPIGDDAISVASSSSSLTPNDFKIH